MRARIVGDWTLAHYAALRREVQRLRARIDERSQIELSGLGALDTAGAGLLVELLGPERIAAIEAWAPQLPAERLALLRTVATALTNRMPPSRHAVMNSAMCWRISAARSRRCGSSSARCSASLA